MTPGPSVNPATVPSSDPAPTSDPTISYYESLSSVLEAECLGNSVLAWLLAIGVSLVVFFAVLLMRRVLLARVGRIAERKRDGLFGLLPRLVLETSPIVAVAIAVYIGSMGLVLGDRPGRLIGYIVVIVVAIQAVLWGRLVVEFGLQEFLKRRAYAAGPDQPDGAVLASAGILRFIALAVLYGGATLLALDNMGIKVTAMIAGLGIGGIAIALAAQNILGDLFGSLSIVLDKPFVVGDFIIVGEQLGTVEKIGIKTTRVRSLSGEQLVFANSDLLNSRVRNFKRMAERRVVFAVGVTYQTPADKLLKAQEILTEAVKRLDKVRFDRAHFKAFGAFSLDFEIVYHVLAPDFNTYMDKQQAINLHIYSRFAEEGIDFAYPTQTLFLADGAIRVTSVTPPSGNAAADRAGNGQPADGQRAHAN